MFNKPEREYLDLASYKSGMASRGRTFFQEAKARRAYMDYLHWYRKELAAYREKMAIVKAALDKLTQEEQDILRLYWK